MRANNLRRIHFHLKLIGLTSIALTKLQFTCEVQSISIIELNPFLFFSENTALSPQFYCNCQSVLVSFMVHILFLTWHSFNQTDASPHDIALNRFRGPLPGHGQDDLTSAFCLDFFLLHNLPPLLIVALPLVQLSHLLCKRSIFCR